MRTKDEQIEIQSKRDKLLKIGSRVFIKYPKCDEFMKLGTIVSYYKKSPVGKLYWDYMIRMDCGKFHFTDNHWVEEL